MIPLQGAHYMMCVVFPMATDMALPHSNHAVLRGHSGPVYSLALTQSGRHVLSASEDTSGARRMHLCQCCPWSDYLWSRPQFGCGISPTRNVSWHTKDMHTLSLTWL